MKKSSYESMIVLPKFYEVEKILLNKSLSILHKIVSYEKKYGTIVISSAQEDDLFSEYFGSHMIELYNKYVHIIKESHDKQFYFEYNHESKLYDICQYIPL
jgi:hypothetical protein